jgi:uncharacterized protein YdeI (BOF family)
MALAGAVTLLLGSSVFAQNRNYPRADGNRGYANRIVEGTVASVVHDRNGERVRLTNGMDLLVPNSISSMNQGRRFGASMLQPGDVVRMNVYSREGDGRDAQVRSLELLRTSSVYNNDRRLNGTVVSFDRRARMLVMQTDNSRTITVDLNAYAGRGMTFRNGDRISVSGRMNRGTFVADDVRLSNTDQHDQYDRRH